MNEIFEYIKKIENEYGITLKYHKVKRTEEELKNVPILLRDLYRNVDGIIFPFGTVYTLEEALRKSENLMSGIFFSLGQDYTNDHRWLCSYKPNEIGASFNLCTFSEPDNVTGLYREVIEFFEEMRRDYDEDPWNKQMM